MINLHDLHKNVTENQLFVGLGPNQMTFQPLTDVHSQLNKYKKIYKQEKEEIKTMQLHK